MKYSILDLKNDFNKEENTVDVYFQDKFVMTINQLGDNSLPSLVCHPSHTINEYLEEPFIIAGGYNNSDLYTIRGEKLTDFKFWAILSSPIIYKNNLYFKVRTSKGKTGIINDKGDIVIPFVYDEDISLSGFINIEENGLLYVKKDNLYGIINLKNETMLDFQPSKDVVMVRRLKDLNEWDDLLYIVVDGNYTVENIIKNKQCVYCGAKEKLKQQTFVVQEETKIEFREYICKVEKCLKTHSNEGN